MERPVYHFKGIVKDGAEATKDFVGPLDLILHLLKKNKKKAKKKTNESGK